MKEKINSQPKELSRPGFLFIVLTIQDWFNSLGKYSVPEPAVIISKTCLFRLAKELREINKSTCNSICLSDFCVNEEASEAVAFVTVLGCVDFCYPYDATVAQGVKNSAVIKMLEILGYRKIENTDDFYKFTKGGNNA